MTNNDETKLTAIIVLLMAVVAFAAPAIVEMSRGLASMVKSGFEASCSKEIETEI